MSKKLLVDSQILQTPALHRGMGKYSLNLLTAVKNSKYWDEIELLFSDNLPFSVELKELLKNELKDFKYSRIALLPNKIGDRTIAEKNRVTIDGYLPHDNLPTDYLVLSLMQGEIHPVFPTSNSVNKLVIFYDLIPLMFHKIYLQNPITREEYLFKIKELLKADIFLTISKTVANDLTSYLGIDRKRVVSIDGGPIPHSQKPKKIDIPKPYILMPTGNDLRKNNQRAVRAFEMFNRENQNRYSLVITSFFKPHEINDLKSLSENVIFTGNISGVEMDYLYKNAKALLFPSEYEGLGLPNLEAMQDRIPIACSDISVFREMSDDAFYYFDPLNENEISYNLSQAVVDSEDRISKYNKVLELYTWHHTGEKLVEAVQKISKDPESLIGQETLIFAPDISKSKTILSEHILKAHAEISRQVEVSYAFDIENDNSEAIRVNFLPYITNSVDLDSIKSQGLNSRINLYHIDNDPIYAKIMLFALAVPGVLYLHNTDVSKVWEAMVKQKFIDQSRFDAERELDKQKQPSLLTSLLARQALIIVGNIKDEKVIYKIAKTINSKVKVAVITPPNYRVKYQELVSGFDDSEDHYSKETHRYATAMHDLLNEHGRNA